jgi:alpha-L-rhamnosidase
MMDAKQKSDTVLKAGGPKGISTCHGFYVLQALAKSGEADTALD